jgi:hypothetical protein
LGAWTTSASTTRNPEGGAPDPPEVDSVVMMHTAEGTIESGAVRIDRPEGWAEGQRVLVIALPPDTVGDRVAPPSDLLEEDARELATRPAVSRSWGDELK